MMRARGQQRFHLGPDPRAATSLSDSSETAEFSESDGNKMGPQISSEIKVR